MRTQKDRAEQILTWRQLYEVSRLIDTLPLAFAGALASAFKRTGLTKAALARNAGMPADVLASWLTAERLPHPASYDDVLRLERALGLPAETLIRRLPPRRLARSSTRMPNRACCA